MAMKLKMRQENFISKPMTLLSGMLLCMLFCGVPALTLPAYAAATNYTDPVGYPGSWPLDSRWIPYTSSGTNVSDVEGGNSNDSYTLTVQNSLGGDQFNPVFVDIYHDTNGNGIFNPGAGTLYNPGINDPALAGDVSGTTPNTVTVNLGDLTPASPAQAITLETFIN